MESHHQQTNMCKISEVTINKCSKKLEENDIIMNKINELSKVNKS